MLADAFGIEEVELVAPGPGDGPRARRRSPRDCTRRGRPGSCCGPGTDGRRRPIGVVGEVDPEVLEEFGLDAERRRVGWLEVDLEGLLLDAPRRSSLMAPVSRFPSSDVDLAFVVDDAVPAAAVEKTLRRARGRAARVV